MSSECMLALLFTPPLESLSGFMPVVRICSSFSPCCIATSMSPPPVPKRMLLKVRFVGRKVMPPTGWRRISTIASGSGVAACSEGCTPANVVFGESLSVLLTTVSFEPTLMVVAEKMPEGFWLPLLSKSPWQGHVTVAVPVPDGPCSFLNTGVRITDDVQTYSTPPAKVFSPSVHPSNVYPSF